MNNGTTRPLEERFWEKVQKTPGCWPWRGCVDRYGTISVGTRAEGNRDAHRVSWEIHYGPIPKGMCVLHSCDNRPCVRPDHLFLGTKKDNSEDAKKKGRIRWNTNGKGEKNPAAKLTQSDAINIAMFDIPRASLAMLYGVGRSTIYRIKRKESWYYGE